MADVIDAITNMTVRGAPAIGIAAAYGVVLAARQHFREVGERWRDAIHADMDALHDTRPTAINLRWALDTMRAEFDRITTDPYTELLTLAGAAVVAPGSGVLTHCNAGALARACYGTALVVIRSARRAGRIAEVFATETRPWLQGARLTAWELKQDGIDTTLIADLASAYLMQRGSVQWVVTGADRIAANGDTANKIGTYALATLARAHGVKFMVAAPLSSIDRDTPSGAEIPIEHRGEAELTHLSGQRVAAADVHAFNPVFDVTPAHLIDVLATEKGIVENPDEAAIRRLFET